MCGEIRRYKCHNHEKIRSTATSEKNQTYLNPAHPNVRARLHALADPSPGFWNDCYLQDVPVHLSRTQ